MAATIRFSLSLAACLVFLPGIAEACAFHAMNLSSMDIVTTGLLMFHQWLVQSVESLFRGDGGLLSLLWMMAGGLAYGILHTLGPGHGKMVVGTWSLTQESNDREITLMIVEIAVLHILSAVVAVALVELVLTALNVEQDIIPVVRAGSYLIIAFFGLVIAFNALRGKQSACATCGHDHGSDHHHDHHHSDDAPAKKSSRRWVSVLVGAPPCSGAAIVLLMALAHDQIWSGLLIAGAIAIGMALALGGLAWLARWGRQRLASMIVDGRGPVAMLSLQTLSLFGGLLIAGFGGLAFMGAYIALSHGA